MRGRWQACKNAANLLEVWSQRQRILRQDVQFESCTVTILGWRYTRQYEHEHKGIKRHSVAISGCGEEITEGNIRTIEAMPRTAYLIARYPG